MSDKKNLLKGTCQYTIVTGKTQQGNDWYGISFEFEGGYIYYPKKNGFIQKYQVKQIKDGKIDYDF